MNEASMPMDIHQEGTPVKKTSRGQGYYFKKLALAIVLWIGLVVTVEVIIQWYTNIGYSPFHLLDEVLVITLVVPASLWRWVSHGGYGMGFIQYSIAMLEIPPIDFLVIVLLSPYVGVPIIFFLLIGIDKIKKRFLPPPHLSKER